MVHGLGAAPAVWVTPAWQAGHAVDACALWENDEVLYVASLGEGWHVVHDAGVTDFAILMAVFHPVLEWHASHSPTAACEDLWHMLQDLGAVLPSWHVMHDAMEPDLAAAAPTGVEAEALCATGEPTPAGMTAPGWTASTWHEIQGSLACFSCENDDPAALTAIGCGWHSRHVAWGTVLPMVDGISTLPMTCA